MIDSGKKVVDTALSLVDGVKGTAGGEEAVQELGKSALTVTKALNNVLLPIAAVNYAFDKGKDYFQKKFQSDLEAVAKDIPEDSLREPRAALAAPVLQGLAFSHDEPDIKKMYLHLLRTAMDGRKDNMAHPAFPEIIRQLAPEEASLLIKTLAFQAGIPVCEVRKKAGKRYTTLLSHVANLMDGSSGNPYENPDFPMMIENWERLGLVNVKYDSYLVRDGAYDWIEKRPEYISLNQKEDGVYFQKGVVEVTDFGKRFYMAIC